MVHECRSFTVRRTNNETPRQDVGPSPEDPIRTLGREVWSDLSNLQPEGGRESWNLLERLITTTQE